MVNTQQKALVDCGYEGCKRSYSSVFNLRRHIEKVHQGVRRFKCAYCEKYLSSKQNLIDHQNVHSGARPYKCEIVTCGYRFRQLSQFYLHKQMHQEADLKEKNAIIEACVNMNFLTRKITEQSNYEVNGNLILQDKVEGLEIPNIKTADQQLIISLPGLAEVLVKLGINH